MPSSTVAVVKPLRLNLGLSDKVTQQFLEPGSVGRKVLAILSRLSDPALKLLFACWKHLPVWLRAALMTHAWKLYLAVHNALPQHLVNRGLSDSLSTEAHALGNVMWWGRLFPMTIPLMRFALGQSLLLQYPPSKSLRLEHVDLPEIGVRGTYLHVQPASEEAPKVLLWFYGGAFVSGDAPGNIGIAEDYCRKLKCDAFVVDLRRCPESVISDIMQDGCRAYEWLLQRVPAEKIVLYGISSGGGVALRTLQLACASAEDRRGYFVGESPLPMPAGAVLVGPFVDYTLDGIETQRELCKADWVVNQSVLELMYPMSSQLCGDKSSRELSPLFHSMEGLCPLHINVSEHEVCYPQDAELAKKAKDAGVEVDLFTMPYLCHVFQLFGKYLPEAVQSQEAMCSWIQARSAVWGA